MIEPEKVENALYALQGVLIQARKMAYDESQQERLAELLDYAEELPRLIASPKDATEAFRTALSEIAEDYGCEFILDRFDTALPPESW